MTAVAGAITTCLLAGLSFGNVVEMLGRGFVQNRALTLFLLTLPAIALAERYGLQQQAARWMMRFRSQSVARVQIVYQLFRILHGALGIRLNGHPVFVRP